MSDMSEGPGWWLASDGRWYPPEQHRGYRPPGGDPPSAAVGWLPASGPGGVPPASVGPFPDPDPGIGPHGSYGYGSWLAPTPVPVTSGLAIAGLALSILWIGGLGSLVAVIFGIVALSQIRSSGGRLRGHGLATAGLVIGAVGVAGSLVLYASVGEATSHRPVASGHVDDGPQLVPATGSVVAKLTGVPPAVVAAVGAPPQTVVLPPTVTVGQPPLAIDGKPGAVFVGAEFCPYCAVERWAIILAFSRFGTFSHLKETTSSPWDVYPSTATFSFQGASYSSRYVVLAVSEHQGNDVNGPGTSRELEPLTGQEAALWQRYDDSSGYPFLDIGNKALVVAPSFSPALLSGLDQPEIAARLSDPEQLSTEAIVGTANFLTAAICATTGQRPASVCSLRAVERAATAMSLRSGASFTAAPSAETGKQF
jgi:hypothetical protein